MTSVVARFKAIVLATALFEVMLLSMSPLVVSAQLGGPLKPGDNIASLPQYNQGVDQSIKEFLCTPSENPLEQGTALYDCIGRLYRFSLTAGAVILVFFVVLAGYLYITGGETGKGKAKGIILSSITGMGILLGSYALLNFINPQLVEIRPIQAPIFNTGDLPSCEAVGLGVRCITSSGQVNNPGGGTGTVGTNSGCRQCKSGVGSMAYLQNTCMSADAEVGSFVAAGESSCGTNILNTTTGACADGNPAMIGLFQVNITVHKLDGGRLNCPAAFSGGGFTAQNKNCRVKDQDLYNQCKTYASDPAKSVVKSCEIIAERKARGQTTWYPTWHAADCLHKKGLDNFK